MSKAARKRCKDRRAEEKRQRKAANRAMYAAMVGTVANRKKKKALDRSISTKKHVHAIANCGNPGCKKCYPKLNSPLEASPTSSIFGHRWSA